MLVKSEGKEADRIISAVRTALHDIQDEHHLSEQEMQVIVMDALREEEAIPLWIFHNDSLSGLEAIAKYLKENMSLRYVDIADMLNRSDKTIWVTYRNAKRKMEQRLAPFTPDLPRHLQDALRATVPVSLFADRSKGVLEHLVTWLHDELNIGFHNIALILNRDDSTIWTSYHRRRHG